ncbi:hypothetical protein BDP27DRAFT_1446132 [Rhodocollybia butyracea]|uniref:Uncharacterized protein n=1 Tax=Rhodocollybia butyracea TaxID=206335 RepID=A0A9P5U940_9AGAR|nr:hypothetical protein BDP27DRAFT_1446132 [Rhodocollybia butyracea]
MPAKRKSSKAKKAKETKQDPKENFDSVQSKRETLETNTSLLFSQDKTQEVPHINEEPPIAHIDDVSERLLTFPHNGDGPERRVTRSAKRKRGSNGTSNDASNATEKVQQWQARWEEEISAECSGTTKRSRTAVAKPRSRASSPKPTPQPSSPKPVPQPSSPKPAPQPLQSDTALESGDSSNQAGFTRPTVKQLRSILRRLSDYPGERGTLKLQVEETDAMLETFQKIYGQTEAKLTEMKWIRYLIEEDVLRRQKKDIALVDGTEKLGRESEQGKAWLQWRKENAITHRPEAMGLGYWRSKFNLEEDPSEIVDDI